MSAAGSTRGVAPGVVLAMPSNIDQTTFMAKQDGLRIALESGLTLDEYLAAEPDGFRPTASEWERLSQPYRNSDEPSKPSMRRYAKPKNVREFASQANSVATAILNGDIDLDTARAYSAVARTVAQAITAETTHSRFLKTAPNLDFPVLDDDE